jgi:hypothetical protein
MEAILKHTTSDGHTHHEVDIINKKHKVITLATDDVKESSTTEKWGTQQKFVEKLVMKAIEVIGEKMVEQKKTIADCETYNSMGNLGVTRKRLDMNRELLVFLNTYEYK